MSDWIAYYYGMVVTTSDNEMENFIVGRKIKVAYKRKIFARKVYDSKDGPYIILDKTKVFYNDFEYNDFE